MIDFPDEFWRWIAEHRTDDPSRLRLSSKKWSQPWIREAINQVQRRQKCAKKLPTLISNLRTFIPTDLSIEQCTSEPLAHYHASLISEGDKAVDLTAGLGTDAMALALRAKEVTAIERDPLVAEALAYNAKVLGIDNIRVISNDCSDWVNDRIKNGDSHHFDVIFIDPARRGSKGERMYGLADCQPNVLQLTPRLSHIGRRLIVKMSPMLDITAVLREMPSTRRIIALGTTTECKELVADVNLDLTAVKPMIDATTVRNDGTTSSFSFTPEEELAAQPTIAMPHAGDSLYIPYPAVMKAGGLRVLSQRFGLAKPSSNTHLFYSQSIIYDFPGQRLHIAEVLPYASSVIKRLNRRYPTAMVSERNMGLAADSLRRKLGIRDGGDTRIIGFSAGSERYLLIAKESPQKPLLLYLD